jgi:hypothetical protein
VQHIRQHPDSKGCLTLKNAVDHGEHEASIDEGTWKRVQEVFRTNSTNGARDQTISEPALPQDKDPVPDCDPSMKHSHSNNHGFNLPISSQECSGSTGAVIYETQKSVRSPEVGMNINDPDTRNGDLRCDKVTLAVGSLNMVWSHIDQA